MAEQHPRVVRGGGMDEVQIEAATALIFDALDVADAASRQVHSYGVGWYDRRIGTVDMEVEELAKALLAAGWKPPDV